MNHDYIIDKLSRHIYQSILSIHQQHPQWLTGKYRRYAWDSPEFERKLLAKLKEKFIRVKVPDDLVINVIKILRVFLLPGFFADLKFVHLLEQIRQDIEEISELKPSQSSTVLDQACAILLLDAENLQIDLETEDFLATICHYPIQVKIAFANWRSLGKKDIEFHHRGYELIHVPPGKDSADIKMATVGSSMFIHYPTAREILVCSSDQVMRHLGNTLQTHGLTVYLVHKEANRIVVLNQNTHEYKAKVKQSTVEGKHHSPHVSFNSKGDLEKALSEIAEDLIKSSKTPSVACNNIASEFKKRYNLPITKAIKNLNLNCNYLDLLKSCSSLIVKKINNHDHNNDTQVSLAEQDDLIIETDHLIAKEVTLFQSAEEIEAALTKIIKNLLNKDSKKSILIGDVATIFSKQYHQSVTTVIKNLNLGKKYLVFLQSCQGLVVKKINKKYQVKVAPK